MSKYLFTISIIVAMLLIGLDYSYAVPFKRDQIVCINGNKAEIIYCLERQIKESTKECNQLFQQIYNLQENRDNQKLFQKHQDDWTKYVNSGIDYISDKEVNNKHYDETTVLRYKLKMIEHRIKELRSLNTRPDNTDDE